MNIYEKIKVDPTKIKGPYSLLALFLLVVEGLLGYWISLAQSSLERSIAGVLIAIVLLGFLYAFVRWRKSPIKALRPMQGLSDNVTPAKKEATKIEVEKPQPDMMAGPNRTYLITKPPENWTIHELTYGEWLSENLNISDPVAQQKIIGQGSNERNILVFNAPITTKIVPIPGQTLIEGRKFLTALGFEVPIRVAVLPLEKAQPPLFIERTLEHNFQAILSQITAQGVVTLRQIHSNVLQGSGRRSITAEFRQDMSNVMVNDIKQDNISSNITVIGIEGEPCDHLLYIYYPSLQNNIKNSPLD